VGFDVTDAEATDGEYIPVVKDRVADDS